MWMTQYIREIKIQLRDKYHFTPSRVEDGEPCFENIPDGEYPMTIDGKLDPVRVENGRIFCCQNRRYHPPFEKTKTA